MSDARFPVDHFLAGVIENAYEGSAVRVSGGRLRVNGAPNEEKEEDADQNSSSKVSVHKNGLLRGRIAPNAGKTHVTWVSRNMAGEKSLIALVESKSQAA